MSIQKKTEWGVGEVIEDSKGGQVRVFFVRGGERKLSIELAQLRRCDGEQASHPLLDNRILGGNQSVPFRDLRASIARFLDIFPGGFNDANYLQQERNYKLSASRLAAELLDEHQFSYMLKTRSFDEVATRALKVVNATNLIFPNEKMALRDGLVGQENLERFALTLHRLVYSNDPLDASFAAFASVLEDIGSEKWTVATYWPFLLRPNLFMFVKPTVVTHAAQLCGFEINYKPQLNPLTYSRILNFASYLSDELHELGPRDFIDVQSFMWCILPDHA